MSNTIWNPDLSMPTWLGTVLGPLIAAKVVENQAIAYKGVLDTPAPSAPGAPQNEQQMNQPGAWTPDDAIAEGVDKTRQIYNQFFAEQDARNQLWEAEQSANSNAMWWIAGGIVAVYVAAQLIRRGR